MSEDDATIKTVLTQPQCPACKKALEKYSEHRFKCPFCRSWIYFRDNQLVTKEGYVVLRDADYARRSEERKRERLVEILKYLESSEEEFKQKENEIINKYGTTPKETSVLMEIFNKSLLKLKTLNEWSDRYYELAIYMNKVDEESFHLLKAANRIKLTAMKKDGYKKTYLLTSRRCTGCKELPDVMLIDDALRLMPIPCRECINLAYSDNKRFCVCSYNPQWDDEYFIEQEKKRKP